MSEEEKKAIEYLRMYARNEENRVYEGECIYNIEILLNLIEKQQKEIEELKEECKKVVCVPEGTCFMIKPKNIDKKWNDKIKAKVIEIKDRPVKDEFITASQGKLNTIIEIESLLEKE